MRIRIQELVRLRDKSRPAAVKLVYFSFLDRTNQMNSNRFDIVATGAYSSKDSKTFVIFLLRNFLGHYCWPLYTEMIPGGVEGGGGEDMSLSGKKTVTNGRGGEGTFWEEMLPYITTALYIVKIYTVGHRV
jgi:hypothetical protein